MNAEEFRSFAKAAIDFVADYLENIRERDVLPSVEPGYLYDLLPKEAPEGPENWKAIMEDMEKFIMPGITHWQSPNFHAYYPSASSYSSTVADIICGGMGLIGVSWITSPACAELEVIMMDWLAKIFGLPEHFLNSSPGYGGGVIQGSASESVVIALIAGRELTLQRYQREHPEMTESEIRGKLVAYTSDQSNSCIEKAGMLAAVPIRLLTTDENCALRGETLKKAIEDDMAAGLIPCAVLVTLGTTPTCAFDNIVEIGPLCEQHELWLHIDAAYAGSAFCCPEYRYLMNGIEYADSLNVNLHKWMLINFDCCAMWLRDSDLLVKAMTVERIYLSHKYQYANHKAPDFRHWTIPLGRRMRSLKVWFTLRTIGVENFRTRFRKIIGFAKLFEEFVENDARFEIMAKVIMGIMVFRLKSGGDQTKELLERITNKKKIYMIAGNVHGKFGIRFVVCGKDPQKEDIVFAWNHIVETLDEMEADLKSNKIQYKVKADEKQIVGNSDEEMIKKEHSAMEALSDHLTNVLSVKENTHKM